MFYHTILFDPTTIVRPLYHVLYDIRQGDSYKTIRSSLTNHPPGCCDRWRRSDACEGGGPGASRPGRMARLPLASGSRSPETKTKPTYPDGCDQLLLLILMVVITDVEVIFVRVVVLQLPVRIVCPIWTVTDFWKQVSRNMNLGWPALLKPTCMLWRTNTVPATGHRSMFSNKQQSMTTFPGLPGYSLWTRRSSSHAGVCLLCMYIVRYMDDHTVVVWYTVVCMTY